MELNKPAAPAPSKKEEVVPQPTKKIATVKPEAVPATSVLEPPSPDADRASVSVPVVPEGPVVVSEEAVARPANASLGEVQDFTFGTGSGPAFVYQAPVNYPLVAKRWGREGKVVLRLTLDERGTLVNIEMLQEAGYGFSEAALEAVKKSRFSPACINKRPVASRVILPIRFALRKSNADS